MELSMFDRSRLRVLLRRFTVWGAVLILLQGAVCNPLYLYLSSDIMWRGTVWVQGLELLMTLLNYLFYWVSSATVIFAAVRFSRSAALRFVGVYAVLAVLHYPISSVCGYAVMGFPRASEFVSGQLGGLLFSTVMDLVQMGLLLLSFRFLGREKLYAVCLPFSRLLPKGNPVQGAALLGGVIPAAIRFLFRMYYDIFFYGAPMGAGDLLVMLVYYLSDLFCILLGYFAILLLLNRFAREESRARAEFEAPM